MNGEGLDVHCSMHLAAGAAVACEDHAMISVALPRPDQMLL